MNASHGPTFPYGWVRKPFVQMTSEERFAVACATRTGGKLRQALRDTPPTARIAARDITVAISRSTDNEHALLISSSLAYNLSGQVDETCAANEWGTIWRSDPPSICSNLFPLIPIWDGDGYEKVSFFANITDLFRDRRTTMRIGRFLRSILDAPDDLIQDVVQRLTSTTAVNLAVTADDIALLYTGGPSSCMAGDGWRDFKVNGRWAHPAEVYAYPYDRASLDCEGSNGLAVAYLGNLDSAPCRALVRHHPDGLKEYGAVYGDDILPYALEKAGYKYNLDLLVGCKLALIGAAGDQILMPYLDGNVSGVIEYGDHLRVVYCNEEYDGKSTEGVARHGGNRTCDDCGDRMCEGEGNYLENLDIEVCEDCLSCNYTEVHTSRYDLVWVRDSDAIEIDGRYYSQKYAREIGLQCEVCEEWMLIDDDNYQILSDCFYCDECYEKELDAQNLIRCDWCGEHSDNDLEECESCGRPLRDVVTSDRTPTKY